ncbi:hypothetical protein CHS0354_039796 [Potamilus streckersoni]|uniref:ParB/Sulfiredoxin domain-containing protein n=1 Tax=Potamilus streckersoni TaxID=2493646 RepID=A0AAE0SR00_9BIVA|nr:hypothetical protein CHS0354_039796 [Potamilus streckersoni]
MGNAESTYHNTNRPIHQSRRGSGRIIGETEMRPSQLRFTQDSISNRFQDGHTLDETFRQFLYKEISMGQYEQVPNLVAMQYQGSWFVVRGNRRLYLMKKLEGAGAITTVKVLMKTFDQEVFNRQFTTRNMGLSIRVRGDTNIEQKLNQIVANWRSRHGGGDGQSNDWCILL